MARKTRTKDKKTRIAEGDEDARREKRSFHRGETVNFHPNRDDFRSPSFLEHYLLKGWVPEAPLLTKGMKITAFGSCFAANITRHLTSIGYNLSSVRDPDVYISRLGDGMVNTASILGQFEWALENKKQAVDLWHGYKAEGYGYDDDIRRRTRDIFLGTEFFIITLGLSEVWYDEVSGGTFWRAVPEDAFDPKRHKFRVLSFAETKADIARMHELIRKHVPDAKVLFTVSPIPLAATFRPVSCLTANLASKAIIRAAMDEFLREREDELNKTLFYFPSMELVQLAFPDPWGEDQRHPNSYVLDTVMKTFEAAFCDGGSKLADAEAMLQMFRAENIEDIKSRGEESEERRKLLEAARDARRQGRVARREAKTQQAKIGGAGISTEKDREKRRTARATPKPAPKPSPKQPGPPKKKSWKERRAEQDRTSGKSESRTERKARKAAEPHVKRSREERRAANGKDQRKAERRAAKTRKDAAE